jgi:tRNA(fMet)-specific endonuclease VapC
MMYMLDTDTLVFMIRGLKSGQRQVSRRNRARRLVDRCREAQSQGDTIAVSAITVSELEYGAHCSNEFDKAISAIRKVLTPFERIDYDAQGCAEEYGRIRHALESVGQPIGGMDLLIAAHAVSLNGTLVTNNVKHFQRVEGLGIVNWSRA